jgi:PPOX class probable F420-dependent enzyme
MPSRRDQIRMSEDDLRRFLAEQEVLVVATDGPDGRPHLTALWYVLRDGEPWIFTYARSQKVRNLERSPRATLLLESGVEYADRRGASLYVDATIHRDPEVVAAVADELFARYRGRGGEPRLGDAVTGAVRERLAKRVAVQFRLTRSISWDHAKLGGAY